MKRRYSLNKEEIQNLIETGISFKIKNAIFFYKKKLDNSKIAVGVAKKIKPIVQKNKIRRQIKNFFYQNKPLWQGLEILIIVKTTYLNNDFQTNTQIILEGLKRIK